MVRGWFRFGMGWDWKMSEDGKPSGYEEIWIPGNGYGKGRNYMMWYEKR